MSFSPNTTIYVITQKLLHVSVTSNHHQADISVYGHDIFSICGHDMFSASEAPNMSCPCTKISA